MAADIKYNYKLNIKGLVSIDGDEIAISVEDGGDYSLAYLCKDFEGKVVKITVAYDEEYEDPAIKVNPETGEVI
jgi:hypothetical protein